MELSNRLHSETNKLDAKYGERMDMLMAKLTEVSETITGRLDVLSKKIREILLVWLVRLKMEPVAQFHLATVCSVKALSQTHRGRNDGSCEDMCSQVLSLAQHSSTAMQGACEKQTAVRMAVKVALMAHSSCHPDTHACCVHGSLSP